MRIIAAVSVILVVLLAGCKPKESVSVDVAKACSPDNEKKYVSIEGYLNDNGSIFCSNTGGRMDCSLDFSAQPAGERVFSADIEEGNSANEIAKIESNYKASDLKIFDNAGVPIKLSDKVKVTGEMNVGGGACFLEVDRIEK